MFILDDGKSQKSKHELLRIKDIIFLRMLHKVVSLPKTMFWHAANFELRKSETEIGFPDLPRKLTGVLPFNGIV